jgi:hypothetical protein
MSEVQVKAWKCDREACGHVWIASSDTPPPGCAKCKSKAWNRGEGSRPREIKPRREKPVAVVEKVIQHVTGVTDEKGESWRLVTDYSVTEPEETDDEHLEMCQMPGCRRCRRINGG